ncbi:MAG: RNA polymerase sigma factor [Solirubrobacterales bacterium]
MARTLAGELAAFATLVDRHRDPAFRLAARIVGPQEAEDVVQDALLRAFHHLAEFRREASFRTWLLRITHNRALDTRARRRPDPVAEVPEPEPRQASGVRTPAEALEQGERRERLRWKLSQLRPAHGAVLALRDLDGMSYDEIAELTGVPLGSVKARLHRARAELIELLRRNTYDWELPDEP